VAVLARTAAKAALKKTNKELDVLKIPAGLCYALRPLRLSRDPEKTGTVMIFLRYDPTQGVSSEHNINSNDFK